ncbi:sulfatase-like hydrolase/transferase [Pullulanibacillus sp. KACC 23026]|uniref:sulfatase-like hydrolase/transferase n=1 Tax=Pullulanibacillus sp. KACC 23026 TaxID=3028315 RepID=UPI0023B16364|nr:sulfatase-like hydrolase/transferase [Pullulanibacillus sp. KACC 23026]WEG11205.1 sulfatase-like hydrolase/transferase [Pullulanibacillus sp. KACC 23026]
MKKPHIVIFNPDQWRGDVMGHLGNQAAVTPNLDQIIQEEAVSFQNTFCQNPVCTPSRCSFMTGWYPHVRGHRTMFHMLRKDEPVLLKTLKESGYFVWWGGKNDLVPAEYGYEDYCDVKYEPKQKPNPLWGNGEAWRGDPESDTFYSFYVGKLDNASNEKYYDPDWANVLGAVEQIKNRPEDQPLCLYLPLSYPHPPYAVEEPWFSLIDRSKIPERIQAPENWEGKPSLLKGIYERQGMQTWTEDRWKELRATYYGMCARVDHQFGLIVKALKETGIYEETAIFFFSDHGDFTGDYGLVEKTQNTFEDCLTNVPLIIKPPVGIDLKPGINDALVELIDISATIEELTNIKLHHTHFGRSLVPLISGKVKEHRNSVFCEGGRLANEEHCKEKESNSSKEGGLYWPRLSFQINDGPEHTKAVMCRNKRYKYVRRLYEKDELYDLQNDPSELNNCIDEPEMKDILSELKERMLTFYQETCDVVPHDPNLRGIPGENGKK